MSQRNIKTREGYEFWDRLCAIPRYAFLLAPSGNRVQKVEGVGDWIDRHEAQIVVDDAQSEVNVLRSEVEQLKVELSGQQERAQMLLKAKDEWANRARAAEAERDALRAEVGQRVDWQAKCLKRGFDYVRESDDHYVLADIPEMAALLGELLGVEVRSKENDSYGETVSELREQLESANAAFHRAYELEKENEGLRKDAEIGRVARRIASELHDSPKSALSQLARAIDAAMAAEGGDQ